MNNLIQKRAETISRKIALVNEFEEPWKMDHDGAMRCFWLEEIVNDANEIYGDICRIDHRYHLDVFEFPELHSEEMSLEITKLFTKWNAAALRIWEDAEKCKSDFAARGFDVGVIASLKSHLDECQALLNPLVKTVECDDLASQALDDHRRGCTEAF